MSHSQQAAAATRPYRGLVHAPASCTSGNLPDLDQESGLLAGHLSGLMNWGVLQRRSSTVSRARCAGALS